MKNSLGIVFCTVTLFSCTKNNDIKQIISQNKTELAMVVSTGTAKPVYNKDYFVNEGSGKIDCIGKGTMCSSVAHDKVTSNQLLELDILDGYLIQGKSKEYFIKENFELIFPILLDNLELLDNLKFGNYKMVKVPSNSNLSNYIITSSLNGNLNTSNILLITQY